MIHSYRYLSLTLSIAACMLSSLELYPYPVISLVLLSTQWSLRDLIISAISSLLVTIAPPSPAAPSIFAG